MRKFLTALMAVFMLTAALAVLPASATTATASELDGSTAADANIGLVITEVLADTKSSNAAAQSDNAYQYIEVHNRGTETVYLYNYAIVRATYNQNSAAPWESKKFTGKIVIDSGSIYRHWESQNVAAISGYNMSTHACVNQAGADALAPGETALIWVWNQATTKAISAKGSTTGEKAGTMTSFIQHYSDMGTPIPEGVKIFAAFGQDNVGQSFNLNTSGNYMYALVDDGVVSGSEPVALEPFRDCFMRDDAG
jgi:hypothetical protein